MACFQVELKLNDVSKISVASGYKYIAMYIS